MSLYMYMYMYMYMYNLYMYTQSARRPPSMQSAELRIDSFTPRTS